MSQLARSRPCERRAGGKSTRRVGGRQELVFSLLPISMAGYPTQATRACARSVRPFKPAEGGRLVSQCSKVSAGCLFPKACLLFFGVFLSVQVQTISKSTLNATSPHVGLTR